MTAETAPASIQDPGDFQLSLFQAWDDTYDRWASFQEPAPSDLALLPRLTGVTFDVAADHLTATWGALPSVDGIEIYAAGPSTTMQIQEVDATTSWIAATGAATVGFDSTIPNYQAAWWLDPTAYSVNFSALGGSIPGYGTGISASAGVASTARVANRAHTQLLRARHRRT